MSKGAGTARQMGSIAYQRPEAPPPEDEPPPKPPLLLDPPELDEDEL